MKSRGFTLIELMISLALFGLIASGALTLVMSGTRSQARSARVDVAQSGLRAGLDFMTRDLLSASAGAKNGTVMVGATGVATLPIVVTNNSTLPDQLDIYTIDASVALTGVPIAATTDTIGTATRIDVNNGTVFNDSDLILLSNLADGVLIRMTKANATSLTISNPNTFPTGVTFKADGSTMVFRARHATYSVVTTQYQGTSLTTVANGSALMLDLWDGTNGASNPQPLAEGVEDFQVELGIDSNLDKTLTENGASANDDEWVFNKAGETMPVTLANLKAVRITIVAKTTAAEVGTFPARPAAGDRAAGAADGFPRRVIRTMVTVRNFNL